MENKNYGPEYFFQALNKWQGWLEECKRLSLNSLEVARSKPAGAQHDPNLYMAEDGTIWSSFGSMWCEMKRSLEAPFAEYSKTANQFPRGKEEVAHGSVQSVERPNGTKLVFVKRSWNEHMAEDWGWEVKTPGSWPSPYSTARYYEENLLSVHRGLRLATVLFEKREQIEKWMEAYAKSQGELRASDYSMMNNDWDAMMERFAPGLKGVNVPDNGSVHCALHMVLDQIACGRQVRGYAW